MNKQTDNEHIWENYATQFKQHSEKQVLISGERPGQLIRNGLDLSKAERRQKAEMNNDIQQIWEAYSTPNAQRESVNFQQDALKDPTKFELCIYNISDEDWDGNYIERRHATLYTNGNYSQYENISNQDDIDELIDAFERLNPDGIND